MPTYIIMPKQGVSMKEGTVVHWYVQEGQRIERGDLIAQIETNKFINDIESRASGIILKLLAAEGDTVTVNEAIAIVAKPGELPNARAQPTAEQSQRLSEQAQCVSALRVRAVPTVRKLARDLNVDLERLKGTGKDGVVTEADVRAAAIFAPAPLAYLDTVQPAFLVATASMDGGVMPRAAPKGRLERMSHVRKAIARHMKESQDQAAQATVRVYADMTELKHMRNSLKTCGQNASFNDFLILVVARALVRYPRMSAQWADQDLFYPDDINIGLAVATDRDELFVPVIRNADKKSLAVIAQESVHLVEKAREGALDPTDMGDRTFTLSNLGMLGAESFTAILNPPETGILAVGSMSDCPVAINGVVEIRPIMSLTLTYDHRVVDGAYATKFLTMVQNLLQTPYLIL